MQVSRRRVNRPRLLQRRTLVTCGKWFRGGNLVQGEQEYGWSTGWCLYCNTVFRRYLEGGSVLGEEG